MQDETILNLRWDFFTSHLATTLDSCYEKQHFVDITLVCEDGVAIKCHKMILASASAFFRKLLVNNEHPHPMIILHDIAAEDLRMIVNFIYCGEIEVAKSKVSRLLKVAEKLEINGLKDIRKSRQFNENYELSSRESSPEQKYNEKDVKSPSITQPKSTSVATIQIKPKETPDQDKSLIFRSKTGVKSNYNLRQRSTRVHKLTNNIIKSRVIKKPPEVAAQPPPSPATPPPEALTPPVDVNNKKIRKNVKQPQQNFEHLTVTNHRKNLRTYPPAEHQCEYLKKLKLLNEVEIIKKSYTSSSVDKKSSISPLNCGIFIKDEVDISSDDESTTVIRKKSFNSPAIDILKCTSMGESVPSTSSRTHYFYN